MARFERRDRVSENCRREIAANCGPFSTVSERAGKARLNGGGCSHLRTCLCSQFPANREIYREFRIFRAPKDGLLATDRCAAGTSWKFPMQINREKNQDNRDQKFKNREFTGRIGDGVWMETLYLH
jgi:hypothetical protein